MTRVDEFNSFYASTAAQVLQVTYAVAGDRHVAFEATVDAYRRAWRDWSKIRDLTPVAYVRTEAWRLTALARGTHPLRRRHEDDGDSELLDALAGLSSDDRRLIALMTLGDTDLEEASREVGLPAEEGIENVTTALSSLEASLGQTIDQIERRLHDLSAVTTTFELPPSAAVRRAAKRGRQRNTVLLVAASVVMVLLGGLLVTDGDALASRDALPYREKIGAERPDLVLNANKLDTDNLLTTQQVQSLDSERDWSITGTDEDVDNDKPYATCPTQRFADDDPVRVFVRTYRADGDANERVAQAIEVSHTPEDASAAYKRLVSWYSDCEHPRVQLVDAYTVTRPFGDFQILRLRSHRSPERTFTVGFSHSGTVTSTLVHEIDSDKGPDITAFANTLNESVSRVCLESGGTCTPDIQVTRADPPPTSNAPEFLGIVDLPAIGDIDKVWAGVDPYETGKNNPAATTCDAAEFTGDDVQSARSRVFVIPEASELPREFGVAETVARFSSDDAARTFVDDVAKRVDSCADSNLSVKVDQRTAFDGDAYRGTAWRLGFEVDANDDRVYYRMAIVRRGSDVAQVAFTPVGDYDISGQAFADLGKRAGQRLTYLD